MWPRIDWRTARDYCSLATVLLCALLVGCRRGPQTSPGKASEKAVTANKKPAVEQPAIVRLRTIPAFRTWGVRETASDALARIGDAAVPALIETLRDPDEEVRAQAAQALARMGAKAAPAVDALMQALDDPNEEVRRGAARALGQIGSEAEQAVPALINAIKDPRNKRQEQAVEVDVEVPAKTDGSASG